MAASADIPDVRRRRRRVAITPAGAAPMRANHEDGDGDEQMGVTAMIQPAAARLLRKQRQNHHATRLLGALHRAWLHAHDYVPFRARDIVHAWRELGSGDDAEAVPLHVLLCASPHTLPVQTTAQLFVTAITEELPGSDAGRLLHLQTSIARYYIPSVAKLFALIEHGVVGDVGGTASHFASNVVSQWPTSGGMAAVTEHTFDRPHVIALAALAAVVTRDARVLRRAEWYREAVVWAWDCLLHGDSPARGALALGHLTCALREPAHFRLNVPARVVGLPAQPGVVAVRLMECETAVRTALRERTRNLVDLTAARYWRPWHDTIPNDDNWHLYAARGVATATAAAGNVLPRRGDGTRWSHQLCDAVDEAPLKLGRAIARAAGIELPAW